MQSVLSAIAAPPSFFREASERATLVNPSTYGTFEGMSVFNARNPCVQHKLLANQHFLKFLQNVFLVTSVYSIEFIHRQRAFVYEFLNFGVVDRNFS